MKKGERKIMRCASTSGEGSAEQAKKKGLLLTKETVKDKKKGVVSRSPRGGGKRREKIRQGLSS